MIDVEIILTDNGSSIYYKNILNFEAGEDFLCLNLNNLDSIYYTTHSILSFQVFKHES